MRKQKSIFIKNVALPKRSLFENEIQLVANKIDIFTGKRNRSSQSTRYKRVIAAQLVIEGLYQGFCNIQKLPLTVPHHPKSYSQNSSSQFYGVGYRILRSICDTLEHLGWVKRDLGYRSLSEKDPTTELRPTGDLLEAFNALGIAWQEMEPLKNNIQLRNYDSQTKKKYSLPVPDDEFTNTCKTNLDAINHFICKQAICLAVTNSNLSELARHMSEPKRKRRYDYRKDNEYPLNFSFSMVQLKRIFARSSMGLGGRFYGGWWQFIPKEYRPYITVNGHPTVEIDYSGLHPYMLYHLEGLDPPEGDIYDIGLWGNDLERSTKRPLVKEFFNASINDQYGYFRLTQLELSTLGVTQTKLVKLITSKHSAIAHRFSSGYGLHLQWIDSQLAERVMLLLMDQNKICLPVHDSFIGLLTQRNAIIEAMKTAYFERFNKAISLASKDLYMQDASGNPKYQRQFPLPFDKDGLVDRATMFQQHNDSIHGQYVRSYSCRGYYSDLSYL